MKTLKRLGCIALAFGLLQIFGAMPRGMTEPGGGSTCVLGGEKAGKGNRGKSGMSKAERDEDKAEREQERGNRGRGGKQR